MVAGMCLCSKEGLRTRRLRNAWYLKSYMPAFRKSERCLIDAGRVVAKLTSHDPREGDALRDTVWLHIGLQYWNPKRATFLEMMDVGDCDEDDAFTQLEVTDHHCL